MSLSIFLVKKLMLYCLDRLKQQLLDGGMTESEDNQIKERTKAAVQEAYVFARESAYPDASEATQHVFV